MRACSFVLLWLLLNSSLFAASAKLVVKNARLFTMAPQQRDPFMGYLVVGEDGTIVTVAAGDPPASLSGAQVFDAHGDA
jgi:5-methylthioadenosine/S-adenosylhomocysteine deaminase